MPWEEAKNNCKSKSMRLFEPRSPTLNSEVYNTASKPIVWLGISDLPKEDGRYRYESNKKEVESGMWYSGIVKISTDSNKHCVMVMALGAPNLNLVESRTNQSISLLSPPSWFANDCSSAVFSICEEIQ